MEKTVLVYDISHYQDDNATSRKVDFNKMKQTAHGVFFKAGQGILEDEDFKDYCAASKNILPRGFYWFWDSRYAPLAQAAKFAEVVGQVGLPEMEIVGDYEETYGGAYGGWRNFAVFMAELQRLFPASRISVYTNYYYWTSHSPDPNIQIASLNWFKQFPLHLAWYTNTDSYVKIPAPWTSCLYWQFSSHGDGPAAGVESLNIDCNYFQGSLIDFETRYGLIPATPPTPSTTDIVTFKNITPLPKEVTYVTVTVNGIDHFLTFTPFVTPPPPVVTPPSNVNLYRVAAERWPELHGIPQPENGGPLVQVASSSTKGGKVTAPLDNNAQAFIKKWNNATGWNKISAPNYGPSQGIDPITLKLKWNYLVWPSGKAEPNYVNVLGFTPDGLWAIIETIPLTFPVPADITPTNKPWLFHKVCDNVGNPVIANGMPIICPLFGIAKYIPTRALIK